MRYVEQIAGALLIALVLVDVFVTVLYARIGSGIISAHLGRIVWRICHAIGRSLKNKRNLLLSYVGPLILALLIVTWVMGLVLGSALVIHPHLGTSIVSVNGPTPTDFVTAIYVAGSSSATLGAPELAARTSAMRALLVFDALTGIAVLSMAVTYIMQVYNALQRRNTLGMKLHVLTAETDDAAELIAGVAPEGTMSPGYMNVTDAAVEMTAVNESHHFYPVLFYFRFEEAFYSVSQTTLIALDAVTLIKSALDDKKCAWLKESASVSQLYRSSLMMVTMLERVFLPGGGAHEDVVVPDAAGRDRWRRRYEAAVRRLRVAGVPTIADESEGLDRYIEMRARWDHHVMELASAGAFDLREVDPTVAHPESSDDRPPFRRRLRSFG